MSRLHFEQFSRKHFTVNKLQNVINFNALLVWVISVNNVIVRKPLKFYENSFLTLRRPLRQSWRLGVFFGSHDSALTTRSKRWNNIPHKSNMAIFLKSSFFWYVACGSHKTRLKNLDSDFTYYGVYLFCTFRVCLYWFLSNHSKTSSKTFIVIQNLISYISNDLFGYFLGYLEKFEVWSRIEKTRDSSYCVIHAP